MDSFFFPLGVGFYFTYLFKLYHSLKLWINKGTATLSDSGVPSQITSCLPKKPSRLSSTYAPLVCLSMLGISQSVIARMAMVHATRKNDYSQQGHT